MHLNTALMLVGSFISGTILGIVLGFFMVPSYTHHCSTVYLLGVGERGPIAVPVDVCTSPTPGIYVAPTPGVTQDFLEVVRETYALFEQRCGPKGFLVRLGSLYPVSGRSGMLGLYVGMYAAARGLNIPPLSGVGELDRRGLVLPVKDLNVKLAGEFLGTVFIPADQCPFDKEGNIMGKHVICAPSLDFVEAYMARYRG